MASKKKTNIEKRRRLAALYERGTDVRFNEDGVVEDEEDRSDDDVVLWVQPPNSLQREQAMRAAQSAKTRVNLAVKDEDSDAYLEAALMAHNLDADGKRNYLLEAQMGDFRQRAIRDVLADDEWSDFSTLQDSMREWEEAGFPEDGEWASVKKRDEEYGKQVQARIKEIMEATRESLKILSDAELEEKVITRYGEALSNQAFMEAYEYHMLYFACRDDENHKQLFFEDVEDMRSMPEFVVQSLADELSEFIKDPREAKNSPRAVVGSQQSVPSSAPETSEASTPKEPKE